MQTRKYLTEADFSNVSEEAMPFGPLGQIVDVRTYRRYKPEDYSRESAVERDIRVINHNLALVADKQSFEELRAEGLLMQQKFAQLRVGPSSRAKWIAGTESVDRHPASIFNCSGMAVNRLGSFADLFELLMLGTGVGFRVFERDIRQLPKLTNKNIQVKFLPYTALPKEQRQEYTSYLIKGDAIHVHIGDSRQGWIDGLMAYLKAVTDPSDTFTQIIYTVDSVRPLGERIFGFGGTASGPEALQGIIQNVVRIIQECPEEYLRSIDCMDVCCAIARGVVAGSTRRSALICLFDEGDELCANAKKGLYTDPCLFHKQYRSQSNNTECIGSRHYATLVAWLKQNPEATEEQIYAFIEQFKPTREQFSKRMVSIKSEGEPGIDNFLGMTIRRYLAARKWRPDQDPFLYMDVVTNPCLTGDTLVLTKQGHFQIQDIVNQEVEVWDGSQWVTTTFQITGVDQPVYKLTLHNGQEITATPYHTFILEDGTRKQLKDLEVGEKLLIHSLEIHGNHSEPAAYLKGFLVGDGTHSGCKPTLHLYETKYRCEDRLIQSASEIEPKSYGTYEKLEPGFGEACVNRKYMNGLSARRESLLDWATDFKKALPSDILNWDLTSKTEFIAGVLDADGSASDTTNGFMYQITSVEYQWLKDFQLLLRTIGVKSRIALTRKAGKQDFGKDRGGVCPVKDAYRLTINQEAAIILANKVTFSRLVSFADRQTKYSVKSREAKIDSIEFSHLADKVYCCYVETNNSFALSNGVITGNCHEIILSIGFKSAVAEVGKSGSFCNLTTNNLPQFVKFDKQGKTYVDYEELEACQRLSTRIGVRQTCVDIPLQGWNETQLEERLLGVSATGWQDMFDMLGWDATSLEASDLRKKMRAWANDEATKYAEKLGIPRPLLVTTVKPEGTTSQVYGVSWGLHNNWSPYYIRRIRITSKDALAQVLLEQGYPCFPEVYDLDKVEDFYEGKDWAELDAWQKLNFFSTLHPHTKKYILDECNTIVFEFPVKSSAKKTQAQVSAVAQLENTRLFALEYTDHMPSSTISVKEDEWDAVVDWLDHNWTRGFVTASFLSFDDAKYPLLPYESIGEEEYQARLAAIPSELKQALDCGRAYFKVDMGLLSKKEYAIDNPDDVSMDADCSKGSCPVR